MTETKYEMRPRMREFLEKLSGLMHEYGATIDIEVDMFSGHHSIEAWIDSYCGSTTSCVIQSVDVDAPEAVEDLYSYTEISAPGIDEILNQ